MLRKSLFLSVFLAGVVFFGFGSTAHATPNNFPHNFTSDVPVPAGSTFNSSTNDNGQTYYGAADTIVNSGGGNFYLYCDDNQLGGFGVAGFGGGCDNFNNKNTQPDWQNRNNGPLGSQDYFEVVIPKSLIDSGLDAVDNSPTFINSSGQIIPNPDKGLHYLRVTLVNACYPIKDSYGWEDHLAQPPNQSENDINFIRAGVIKQISGPNARGYNVCNDSQDNHDLNMRIYETSFVDDSKNIGSIGGSPAYIGEIVVEENNAPNANEKIFTVHASGGAYVDPADANSLSGLNGGFSNGGRVNLQNPEADYNFQGVGSGINRQKTPTSSYTFKFSPDCNSNSANLQWFDAGSNPVTQPDAESWQLYHFNAAGTKIVDDSFTDAQLQNNSSGNKREGGLSPNITYIWEWDGVDRSHGVSIILPYPEVTSANRQCTGWQLTGRATVADGIILPGKSTTFTTWIHASGSDPANFTWENQGCYDASGGPCANANYNNGHCGNNPGGGLGLSNGAVNNQDQFDNTETPPRLCQNDNGQSNPKPALETGARTSNPLDPTSQGGCANSNGGVGNIPCHTETYTFPNGAVYNSQYCIRTHYTNASGPKTAAGDSGPACVKLNSVAVVNCQNITTDYSGAFYLRFVDPSGNYLQTGQLSSGTMDPFKYTGGTGAFQSSNPLRPDLTYTVYMHKWDATDNPDDIIGIGVTLGQCISVSCDASSINVSAVEPGQQVNVKYGIRITNSTDQSYGFYGDKTTASGGLTMISNPNTEYSNLPGNGSIDIFGPPPNGWLVQADYQGSMNAYLLYNGGGSDADISSEFPGLASCPSTASAPETRPYLDVKNGDISTGGGFAYQTADSNNNVIITQCSTSDGFPRYVSPYTANNAGAGSGADYFGGIRTFAGSGGSPYGSSSDFAAYALGLIDGSSSNASKYGFYSAALGGGNYNTLSFANIGDPLFSSNLGGVLGGSEAGGDAANVDAAAHCATDFYDATQKNPTPWSNLPPGIQSNGDLSAISAPGRGSQQYIETVPAGSCQNLSGNVHTGVKLTIYVDGDVCINGNITYGDWSFNGANYTNNAPYLTVIVRGSIYVGYNVGVINGVFIAQPDSSPSTSGIFSTCSNGNRLANPTEVSSVCRTNGQLTINGAVIAQHIYPLRSVGSLAGSDASGPAEIFNLSPSTEVAQPDLKPQGAGENVPNPLDALYNLPPIF